MKNSFYEIKKYLLDLYRQETKDESLTLELFNYLNEKIGDTRLNKAIYSLIEEFPPEKVYQEEVNIEEFLKESGIKPKFSHLEIIVLI